MLTRISITNIAGEIGKTAVNASQKVASNISKIDKDKISETKDNVTENAHKLVEKASSKVKEGANKSTEIVNKVMDVNGDGQVDIEDVIIMGLKVPGICIKREEFLRGEFMKDFQQETIDDAIEFNPAHAGITTKEIEKYADEVIKYERNCVSEKGKKFDTETLNILTLCLGVMYGVAGANNALKAVAKALGSGVQKQLMKKALTKGTVYPIVKSVAKWFGVKMTKEVFTGFFKHAIPVVGGVIGGGLTYVSFKPCCDKLKASLQDTLLSNPDHEVTEEENAFDFEDAEIIEYCEEGEE